ncbi:hypothetical protein LPJ66_006781 [Kickxella alabastrina]|uniref:Uncharacterized protein n=1 Tax=Kickxella alabastrina TaxID=61397 RepID=A0ACC1ID59_9FUNG|nr:hypothetical protein LPJ66_006781 [Kickxella alabastrina]
MTQQLENVKMSYEIYNADSNDVRAVDVMSQADAAAVSVAAVAHYNQQRGSPAQPPVSAAYSHNNQQYYAGHLSSASTLQSQNVIPVHPGGATPGDFNPGGSIPGGIPPYPAAAATLSALTSQLYGQHQPAQYYYMPIPTGHYLHPSMCAPPLEAAHSAAFQIQTNKTHSDSNAATAIHSVPTTPATASAQHQCANTILANGKDNFTDNAVSEPHISITHGRPASPKQSMIDTMSDNNNDSDEDAITLVTHFKSGDSPELWLDLYENEGRSVNDWSDDKLAVRLQDHLPLELVTQRHRALAKARGRWKEVRGCFIEQAHEAINPFEASSDLLRIMHENCRTYAEYAHRVAHAFFRISPLARPVYEPRVVRQLHLTHAQSSSSKKVLPATVRKIMKWAEKNPEAREIPAVTRTSTKRQRKKYMFEEEMQLDHYESSHHSPSPSPLPSEHSLHLMPEPDISPIVSPSPYASESSVQCKYCRQFGHEIWDCPDKDCKASCFYRSGTQLVGISHASRTRPANQLRIGNRRKLRRK